MFKSNRGQLSIFMGITLIIIMSMLAFIINVGLFVKAKINLQNATDAAAFSGAATQARQLTNIAYVNWELRNTYKEWMFKYYVLGELGLFPYNLSDARLRANGSGGRVNFTLPTPTTGGVTDFDKYNIPSICIHNNSKTNICPIYSLPGIPRFPAIGVAGISEIHEAFVDELVKGKAFDCDRRTKQNFLTALTWAYGSGGADTAPDAPLVATSRPGAWPQSLELALRMRNLEMIMNRPPISEIALTNVSQLEEEGKSIGLNERSIKAFWSAYRNLGGGTYKDCNTQGSSGCAGEELSYNLKLTELAPTPYVATPKSISGFLIPDTFSYPGQSDSKAFNKYYVDLQLVALNYATMWSMFVNTSVNNVGMDNVKMEAACGVSKAAIPVPGYIMGFNKNPQVLTYYAVKAESKFIGLFFPIANSGGIKLTAYAAAKPFGGRIGPKLFKYTQSDPEHPTTVEAREDPNRLSGPYISGLRLEAAAAGPFVPGMPIPSAADFWVNDSATPIGGIPGTGAGGDIAFGIPNMIYDFNDENDLAVQTGTNENIQYISPLPARLTGAQQPDQTLGLYHAPQLLALKASIGLPNPGTSMNGDEVLRSIIRSRRPTKYDAINYLVPDFREVAEKNNVAPIVQKLQDLSGVGFSYKLFAPLLGAEVLYKTTGDIENIVLDYMRANDPAIEKYLKSILGVANSIADLKSSGSLAAAQSIHANADVAPHSMNNILPPFPNGAALGSPGCREDLASKLSHYFRDTFTGCGFVPLQVLIVDFINNASTDTSGLTDKSLFYVGIYYNEPSNTDLTKIPETFMTAYFPGVRQKTVREGVQEHPLKIGNETYSAKRNFYSTKFFQMAKVIDNANSGDYKEQPALRESGTKWPQDLFGKPLLNPLKYSDVGSNSYFLDF